jgi:two-component system, OmpR family, sensor kinase
MTNLFTTKSLVKHLSTVLIVWICGLWLATSVGVAWYIKGEINEGFDAALVESAHRLIDLAEHEIRDLGEFAANIQARKNAQYETRGEHVESDSLIYQVVSADQKILLRSTDAPLQVMKKSLDLGFSDTLNRRIYTFRHPTELFYIHVADSLEHRRHATNDTLLWLLLPLLGIMPLLVFIVRHTVARGLQPITDIATEIQKRSEQDLTPLVTQGFPQELQVIANSTNQLFVQLKTALEVERALAAQAAHELRTPLATARMQLAVVADSSAERHVAKGIEKAIESLNQLSQRTEKLLQMSRAQGGGALARRAVDLNRLSAEVMQIFWVDATVAKRLHLKLSTQDTATAIVMGDYDTLAIALRNLIENALRYAPKGTVWVQVHPNRSVSVTDDGEGVDAKTLQRLQTDNSQIPHGNVGHGLGLSIVKAIAEKHEASLVLISPGLAKERGFTATLRF